MKGLGISSLEDIRTKNRNNEVAVDFTETPQNLENQKEVLKTSRDQRDQKTECH